MFRISSYACSYINLLRLYMYEGKLFNYFNGIFCCIGNFKSFRFYQQCIVAFFAVNFLKVFSGFRLLCSESRQNFQRDLMMKCVFLRWIHFVSRWNLCFRKYNIMNINEIHEFLLPRHSKSICSSNRKYFQIIITRAMVQCINYIRLVKTARQKISQTEL